MTTEKLEVSKAAVLKEYEEGGNKVKASLVEIFGERVFKGTIIERVKTFADAVMELGPNHPLVIENAFYTTDTKAIRALKTLLVVAEALREGVVLDWSNSNQVKYEPRFVKNTSGFGFSGTRYADWAAYSYVGSRLYVDTAEKAVYMGKQFIDVFNDIL